ncbi:MAG TPA: DNA polymerase III subunit chi [Burkholderiales bacterium]|nr:DNA polymerase III subunit chi [Burkholderiales bacterium]
MTRIDFYTHVDNSLHLASVLCGKAQAQGSRIFVLTKDRDMSAALDEFMWSFRPASFIPHCRVDADIANLTPVIIGERLSGDTHDEIMLNLSGGIPEQFSRFQRLIEIVTLDDMDTSRARERVINYRNRGYAVTFHSMQKNAIPTKNEQ